MKVRLVRITGDYRPARYAMLYPDGTMMLGLDFSNARKKADAPNREISRKVLRDMFALANEPEKLSALNYGEEMRWNECGVDDMSLWGLPQYRNAAIITDDNRLLVLDEELEKYASDPTQEEANYPVRPSVQPDRPLQLRLLQTKRNLRNGLYLLYRDGSMDSTLCLDEARPADSREFLQLLFAPETVSARTSRTDERWDAPVEGSATPFTDMGAWGPADARTLLAIDGLGHMVVKDTALLSTLNMAYNARPEVTENAISTVTVRQYVAIAFFNHILDDKLRSSYINPLDVRKYLLGDDTLDPELAKTIEKKLYTLRCALLNIIKKNIKGNFSDADKIWRGFPFANDLDPSTESGRVLQVQMPIYRPGDAEYYRNGGNGKDPCLPMYPYQLMYRETYCPVHLTEESMNWLISDANEKRVPIKTSRNRNIDLTSAGVYKRNQEIIQDINEKKKAGWTIQQVVDDIYNQRYSADGIAPKIKDNLGEETRKEKIRLMVSRRWGDLTERKTTIYRLAAQNLTLAEIAEQSGFSKEYVLTILDELRKGKQSLGDYEVGEEAFSHYSSDVRSALEKKFGH